LCSEMAMEASCAPSMRANVTRLPPESTTATFNGQPRLLASATAACTAVGAFSSEIFSGTTSSGFSPGGWCPSSNALRQSSVFGTEALARLGLSLGDFQLMLADSVSHKG
jgi:hypothetical protein